VTSSGDRGALRRAQLRRRWLLALGAPLAAIVVLAIVLLGAGGGSSSSSGSSGSPSSAPSPPTPISGRRSVTSLAARRASAIPSRAFRRLLGFGRPIYCGGPHGNAVAFTFDDGPGPYTHYALKKLAQAHERATFFVVGRSIDRWPGYLTRELKLAAVEDHTYTHVALISLPPSQVTYQLQATAQKIRAGTGEHVQLWRPPYELHNPTVDRIAQQLGLLNVLWDDDSQDSLGANYARITKNVKAGLRPGAIIEMHENRGQTIRALTALLAALHRRDLRSVSVPQLLASDPPSPQQVRQGLGGCKKEGEVLVRRGRA
jgi:peptidoglycan/xylan/chitin deacetylase (PgdA/CDA1 family)